MEWEFWFQKFLILFSEQPNIVFSVHGFDIWSSLSDGDAVIVVQVTGRNSEGRDKARFKGSAEAAFARRRCSCSGIYCSFEANRFSGPLSHTIA